jgi:hypothetical protein
MSPPSPHPTHTGRVHVSRYCALLAASYLAFSTVLTCAGEGGGGGGVAPFPLFLDAVAARSTQTQEVARGRRNNATILDKERT